MIEALEQGIAILIIEGKRYAKDDSPIGVGDMVIDKRDEAYARVETIRPDDTADLRDRCVVELGVPVNQLIKLKVLPPEIN